MGQLVGFRQNLQQALFHLHPNELSNELVSVVFGLPDHKTNLFVADHNCEHGQQKFLLYYLFLCDRGIALVWGRRGVVAQLQYFKVVGLYVDLCFQTFLKVLHTL